MVVAHRHWADAELMTINKRWMCVCAKINNGVEFDRRKLLRRVELGREGPKI